MMSDERRYWFVIDKGKLEYVQDNVTNKKITVSELEDLLNEQWSIIRRDELSMKTMMSNMEKLEKDIDEQQDTINDLNSELEKSSTFIIEQRKENRQLHYQIIELQDKLGMSEKQHDLKQIIELQNENIISKKKIKDLQVSLFLQSKELERQKKK